MTKEQIERIAENCGVEVTYAEPNKGGVIVNSSEPYEDTINRKHLLSEIDDLMQSPWFNNGKDMGLDMISHYGYVERKEAVEVVRDLCVKREPPVIPKSKTGKWFKVDTNMYSCSNCSHCFTIVPEDNDISQFIFCPHCGDKKMEGESE